MSVAIHERAGRVLVADDDHASRMLLGRILAPIGFDITYAENGQKALELFDHAGGAFDIVITDICMPEMNGDDLIRAILGRRPGMPIVAISGYAGPELVHALAACDAVLFEKPINVRAMRAHVEALAATRQCGASSSASMCTISSHKASVADR
ncbi:response regulator [Mariprofundus erugo]|uniref:Response regulator n=1 Tax=Mariprofundus erugo TaxID=2528639 RepID=A0A5R9GQK4_9PROT|nr:response regulator [Mariprofundus erugo]TLS66683.1 response regulator [Mariprofundus erugo]